MLFRSRTMWGNRSQAHFVNLLMSKDAENPYEVEFRHNAFGEKVELIKVDAQLKTIDIMHFGWNIGKVGVLFGHKSCFVPCHHTMLILFVAEYPLGTYNILVGTWN